MTIPSSMDRPPDAPKQTRGKRADVARVADRPTDEHSTVKYQLRLYVAGFSSNTTRAVSNLKAICEEYLNGRYELDVVDIYQQPALARRAQIIAVPTLIRQLPEPLRRIVGDMSRKDRVLVGLDLLRKT